MVDRWLNCGNGVVNSGSRAKCLGERPLGLGVPCKTPEIGDMCGEPRRLSIKRVLLDRSGNSLETRSTTAVALRGKVALSWDSNARPGTRCCVLMGDP